MYRITLALMASILTLAVSADAAIRITFVQDGADVVGEFSGSIDPTGLQADLFGNAFGRGGFIDYSIDSLLIGPDSSGFDVEGFEVTGPLEVEANDYVLADPALASGDLILVLFRAQRVFLPSGYDGRELSGRSVFPGVSLVALGLAGRQYEFTFMNGEQLTVSFAAVPVPAGAVLFLPVAGFAFAARMWPGHQRK